ncbi:uncharacterized protein LOC130548306 isoform X2 [Triplophysa rosa]|uniref:uncharacterized protein LOC130548306 isoform X2 n=1 Tax=Triplophysa rosa TaxID=992332 RepID=UPI002545C247|nr:uncharacterized protein LOC130548306 isoform X2 [Triplophysa rosa]
MDSPFLLYLILVGLLKKGVETHEETQEQKTADVTLSVMEGETVTLESGVTNIQRNDLTVWTFGDTRIALMNKEPGKNSLFAGDDEMFRDKLHLNNQTGDLTITNIRTEHTGFYQLQILSTGDFFRKFLVHVNAPLPVPVITRDSSSLSSKCVLLCSVMNVSHASLSWYKENSLLSSISVSEHIDSSISLHLECLDDSYTCVLNNRITNQTQHLNTDDCHKCSAHSVHPGLIALIAVLCACVLVGVTAAMIRLYCQRKSKEKPKQNNQPVEEELRTLTNGSILRTAPGPIYDQRKRSTCENCSRHSSIRFMDDDKSDDGLYPEEQNDHFEDDVMTRLSVEEGHTVTLPTFIASIEDVDFKWKFAESKATGHSIKFKVIVERTRENDGEISFSTGRFQNRLQLDNHTGSLTLTDFTAQDVGYYKLWIPSKRISKTFDVTKKVLTLQRRNTFNL